MNPEDALLNVQRMIGLADNRHLDDLAVVSIRMGELRSLVYEMRYARSQAQGAMLALEEHMHGEDMDGRPIPGSAQA